jgi:hypothetical protein
MPSEIWKPIPGWPYEASDHGRIRRIGGQVKVKRISYGIVQTYLKKQRPTLMKPRWRKGRWVVAICDRNKQAGYWEVSVGKLVLLAFVGQATQPDMLCRHLDDNQQNNILSNLIWGTRLENADDAKRNGGYSRMAKGPNHYRAVLRAEDVRRIKRLSSRFSKIEICDKLKLTQKVVGGVIDGLTYKGIE